MPPNALSPGAEAAARAVVAEAGYDPEFYCLIDTMANVPYDPYVPPTGENTESGLAAYLDHRRHGRAVEISRLSPLIESIAGRTVRAVNMYVPSDCREKVRNVISSLKE